MICMIQLLGSIRKHFLSHSGLGRQVELLELETNVREDVTITENFMSTYHVKAPI